MTTESSPARIEADAEHRADPQSLVISRISAQHDPRKVTLEVGVRDIRIRRSIDYSNKPRRGGGKRSAVTLFSNESKRRLLFVARNFPNVPIMLTLTYPLNFPLDGQLDGQLVKNHWRRFRQWLVRNGVTYGLWVLEFQKRGAPHFHLFMSDYVDKDAVANAWFKIVASGDPKHLIAGTRIELFRNPQVRGSYVMKYAAKMEQKDVPPNFDNVGRFWGTWGKPTICRTATLPLPIAKNLVRLIRRAHIIQRKGWTSKRRFRDNGRSGFIAWDTSYPVSRILDEFFESGVLYPT